MNTLPYNHKLDSIDINASNYHDRQACKQEWNVGKWLRTKGINLDENCVRMTGNLRMQMGILAAALISEGKKEKAEKDIALLNSLKNFRSFLVSLKSSL